MLSGKGIASIRDWLCHLQAEEGLCAGRVLYHSHVHKSAEEDAQQQEEIVEREHLKAEHRREQVALLSREGLCRVSLANVRDCSALCAAHCPLAVQSTFSGVTPQRAF